MTKKLVIAALILASHSLAFAAKPGMGAPNVNAQAVNANGAANLNQQKAADVVASISGKVALDVPTKAALQKFLTISGSKAQAITAEIDALVAMKDVSRSVQDDVAKLIIMKYVATPIPGDTFANADFVAFVKNVTTWSKGTQTSAFKFLKDMAEAANENIPLSTAIMVAKDMNNMKDKDICGFCPELCGGKK